MEIPPPDSSSKDKTRSRYEPYTVPPPNHGPRSNEDGATSSDVKEKDMDIVILASRSVKPQVMTLPTTVKCPEDNAISSLTDETPSPESIALASRSVPTSSNRKTKQEDSPCSSGAESRKETSGNNARPRRVSNNYVLSKIVDYLQTHTLASYFRNPTDEDRKKSTAFASVTKGLMAASVIHFGDRHDERSSSFLREFRKGLSHASKRHHEKTLAKTRNSHGSYQTVNRGAGQAGFGGLARRKENKKLIDRFLKENDLLSGDNVKMNKKEKQIETSECFEDNKSGSGANGIDTRMKTPSLLDDAELDININEKTNAEERQVRNDGQDFAKRNSDGFAVRLCSLKEIKAGKLSRHSLHSPSTSRHRRSDTVTPSASQRIIANYVNKRFGTDSKGYLKPLNKSRSIPKTFKNDKERRVIPSGGKPQHLAQRDSGKFAAHKGLKRHRSESSRHRRSNSDTDSESHDDSLCQPSTSKKWRD